MDKLESILFNSGLAIVFLSLIAIFSSFLILGPGDEAFMYAWIAVGGMAIALILIFTAVFRCEWREDVYK